MAKEKKVKKVKKGNGARASQKELYKLIHANLQENGEVDISYKDLKVVLNTMQDTIEAELVAGNKVKLDIGRFEPFLRKERMGRNPATGKQQKFPERMKAKFKAGKRLKVALNPA